MKKYLNLVLCFGCFIALQAQKKVRHIDLKAVIVDTASRDTLYYKDSFTVGSYIINNGPDTIIPGDRIYVKYDYAGIVFQPEFPWVFTALKPGDTFVHRKTFALRHSFSHDTVPTCVFARMSVTQEDSIPKERWKKLDDNSSCFTVLQRQWRLGIPAPEQNPAPAYPNPVNTHLYLDKKGPDDIRLFDYTGKQVPLFRIEKDQQIALDLSQTKEGIYLLKRGNHAEKILVMHP